MTTEGFEKLFAEAGCRGWLCVTEVDGDKEVAAGAGELVAPASVVKIVVALEVFIQGHDGRLDLQQPVRVPPARRTPGPTGLSLFADAAEVSVRDLATLVLTISDNAATDMLTDLVGLDSIHATLRSLGLDRTFIPAPLREQLDWVGQDAGFAGWPELAAADLPPDQMSGIDRRVLASRMLDPGQGVRTTARETAALLRLIWRDEAGPAAACAPVRQGMARQVTRQRLALGFPRRSVSIAAKSGSLFGLVRNEAGVITMPDGRRYAAAIFTRETEPWADERQINAAIGAAAASAVEQLRA